MRVAARANGRVERSAWDIVSRDGISRWARRRVNCDFVLGCSVRRTKERQKEARHRPLDTKSLWIDYQKFAFPVGGHVTGTGARTHVWGHSPPARLAHVFKIDPLRSLTDAAACFYPRTTHTHQQNTNNTHTHTHSAIFFICRPPLDVHLLRIPSITLDTLFTLRR